MAKISFEMDTVEKTYSLSIDGKPVTNVSSLSAYMDYPYENDSDGDEDDRCSISIQTMTRNEDEGMRELRTIYASEQGKEGVKIETAEKPVAKHIADFIAANRLKNKQTKSK